MQKIQEQYIYFENLEKTIKTGLSLYLTALFVGCMISVIGLDDVFLHWSSADWMVVGEEFICVGVLYGILYFAIGKIHWLGELHVRLDKKFFGFLIKSNDVIYETLVSTLQNEDQLLFNNLTASKKTSLTKSIFHTLSEDSQLFDALLKSDIFRSWIHYWVTVYGSFTFLLLSLVSFLSAWLLADRGGKWFFGINWALAMFHLGVSSIMGRELVKKTGISVRQIVDMHKEKITRTLEQSLAALSA